MNPHREVQRLPACRSPNSDRPPEPARPLQNQPDVAERYHRVFGKDFIEELQRQNRAAVAREAETLFAQAAEKHADVKIPVTYFGSGGTVGEKAEAELFQIRHLAVGKEAPEIEGEDQDGEYFKLSDYRGKVVLLDFWHRL